MKRWRLYIVLIIMAVIFLSGCLRSSTPSKPEMESPAPKEPNSVSESKNVKEFFPLTLGSQWAYLGEGNEYASFTREVVFVEGDKAQVKENTGGTISTSIYKSSDSEIVRTFFKGETYEDENLLKEESNENLVILKEPLKEGTQWETPHGTRQIEGLDVKVETPAGVFENCIKIKVEYQHSTLYEYFAEGVGLVKREFTSEGVEVSSRLKEYMIKP